MNTAMVLALILALIVAISLLMLALSKTAGHMQQRLILALLGIISAVCLYFTLQP